METTSFGGRAARAQRCGRGSGSGSRADEAADVSCGRHTGRGTGFDAGGETGSCQVHGQSCQLDNTTYLISQSRTTGPHLMTLPRPSRCGENEIDTSRSQGSASGSLANRHRVSRRDRHPAGSQTECRMQKQKQKQNAERTQLDSLLPLQENVPEKMV